MLPPLRYSALTGGTALHHLDLRLNTLPGRALRHMFTAQHTALRSLNVYSCAATDDDFEAVASCCPGLQQLWIGEWNDAQRLKGLVSGLVHLTELGVLPSGAP